MVHHTKNGSAFAVLEDDLRYVDWPAILAGAVLATALSLVLLAFGAAFGLSLGSPTVAEGTSLRWITIAGGIWFVWTAVTSVSAGGYLAGRLAPPRSAMPIPTRSRPVTARMALLSGRLARFWPG